MDTLGLILNGIGVILLFRFAMPYAVRTGGEQNLRLGQKDENAIRRERHYNRWALVGISLVVIGVLMQIVEAVDSRPSYIDPTANAITKRGTIFSNTDDSMVTATEHLVYVTGAGALSSFLVVLVAVIMPRVQFVMAEGASRRNRQAKADLDRRMLLHYVNYFGEQLLHAEQSVGQTSAPAKAALRPTMPVVLALIKHLPQEAQEDATFALIDAYRILEQASQDDERTIAMMESYNLRRRQVEGENTPQTTQIMKRIKEDEARFTVTRSQMEEMTRKNAFLARAKLDELSRALGGTGVVTRTDSFFINPQDTQTDRFRPQ